MVPVIHHFSSILGQTLHKLYVDDNNLAMEEVVPGTRFIDGELHVVEEEVESDSLLPGDQRTAKIIQDIANSISPFIKMTVDCPSLHQDGWMPAHPRPAGEGVKQHH